MIDWNNIGTVFLDMDGTVLDLRFDNYFWRELIPQRFAQRHSLSEQAARDRLIPWFKSAEGRLDWYCVDYWSRELDLDIAGLKLEVADRIAYLPYAAEFLDALLATGKRLVLVTNAHPKTLAIKHDRTGLQAYFQRVVSSHEFGAPKEDPRFWLNLESREPYDPARALLIDDSLPVLRAARDYGLEYLIAVARPDSTGPARVIEEFPSIVDFRGLWPLPNGATIDNGD